MLALAGLSLLMLTMRIARPVSGSVSWRYPLVLLLVCVPLLIFVPAGAWPQVQTSVTLHAGHGCSTAGTRRLSYVAFHWARPNPRNHVRHTGCGNLTVSSDTSGVSFRLCSDITATGRIQHCRERTAYGQEGRDAADDLLARRRRVGRTSNGWYNHPRRNRHSTASDATSGLAGCNSPTYSGPDTRKRVLQREPAPTTLGTSSGGSLPADQVRRDAAGRESLCSRVARTRTAGTTIPSTSMHPGVTTSRASLPATPARSAEAGRWRRAAPTTPATAAVPVPR